MGVYGIGPGIEPGPSLNVDHVDRKLEFASNLFITTVLLKIHTHPVQHTQIQNPNNTHNCMGVGEKCWQ